MVQVRSTLAVNLFSTISASYSSNSVTFQQALSEVLAGLISHCRFSLGMSSQPVGISFILPVLSVFNICTA